MPPPAHLKRLPSGGALSLSLLRIGIICLVYCRSRQRRLLPALRSAWGMLMTWHVFVAVEVFR